MSDTSENNENTDAEAPEEAASEQQPEEENDESAPLVSNANTGETNPGSSSTEEQPEPAPAPASTPANTPTETLVDSAANTTANTSQREEILSPPEPQQLSSFTDIEASNDEVSDVTATVGDDLYNVSLAFCRTTPKFVRYFLPICMLATHVVFYYGQTAPMWKLRVFAHIDAWANATDFTSKRTFDTLGLDYDQNLRYDEDRDVQTFTYYFAIEHLWKAKDLPGKTLPRLAAVLLIVFSGIWPHLKLLWLNMTWFFGKHAQSRSRTLQWLSTLGKWSLADVLVVCVMVGVLHLDWLVVPGDIKRGIITDLPAIITIVKSQYTNEALCDKFLKMTCANQKNVIKKAKCAACQKLVHEAYTHPEWARSTGASILKGVDTNGGGIANLRVVGMKGIYAFCGAVIVSILLSLIVDVFDHRAKQAMKKEELRLMGQQRIQQVLHRQQQQLRQDSSASPLLEGNTLDQPLLGPDTPSSSPLEVDFGSISGNSQPSTPPTLFSWFFMLVGLFTTALVFMAVDADTMERRVHGAGPKLLHDILGVDWELPYSLRSLMWTTGAHGEWDNLLMATFGLFCVVGPVVRAVLLNVTTVLDKCSSANIAPLATLISFIGAFCSWEVFAIAIVMVQMLMPSITNTIIQSPVCGSISDDGSCLQVEFNILPAAFSTIVIGGMLLLGSSFLVVRRGTDRGVPSGLSTPPSAMSSAGAGLLSRITPSTFNYQRISGIPTDENDEPPQASNSLEDLVFETNQI